MPAPSGAPQISVVIPAYKGRFLADALASLAAQSDPDFEVIVADDASPDDIRGIVEPFLGKLRLRYERFAENLGGRDLTGHWQRAIDLATNDWIWLIGDDDALEPEAMRAVRAAIAAEPHWPGLWHVDVLQVDSQGNERRPCKPFPPLLSASEFVRARFRAELSSFACEYVFRRSVLEDRGGFVALPLAWCSDDATWVRLAGDAGIRTVAGPDTRARWRWSGQNISSKQDNTLLKLESMVRHLERIRAGSDAGKRPGSGAEWLATLPFARSWLYGFLHRSRFSLAMAERWAWSGRLGRVLGQARGLAYYKLWRLEHSPTNERSQPSP